MGCAYRVREPCALGSRQRAVRCTEVAVVLGSSMLRLEQQLDCKAPGRHATHVLHRVAPCESHDGMTPIPPLGGIPAFDVDLQHPPIACGVAHPEIHGRSRRFVVERRQFAGPCSEDQEAMRGELGCHSGQKLSQHADIDVAMSAEGTVSDRVLDRHPSGEPPTGRCSHSTGELRHRPRTPRSQIHVVTVAHGRRPRALRLHPQRTPESPSARCAVGCTAASRHQAVHAARSPALGSDAPGTPRAAPQNRMRPRMFFPSMRSS